MPQDIQDWLIKWFSKRRPQKGETDINIDTDFYRRGLIDSFGVIELIGSIETHFSIMFTDDDFHLASFRTIRGLSDIIDEKRSLNIDYTSKL